MLESLRAEEALLGALLVNNKSIEEVSGIDGKEFSTDLNRRIFLAIKNITERGRTATPATLAQFFEGDADFNAAGGIKYLYTLGTNSGLLINVPSYGQVVIDLFRRRELKNIFQMAINSIDNMDWKRSAASVASDSMHNIEACLKESIEADEQNGMDVLSDIINDFTIDRPIYKTGFPLLNEAMGGGLHAGMAYGIGGRKKSGKTIMATSLSYNLSEQGVPHLFICGEMSAREIHTRNICRATGLWPSQIRNRDTAALEKLKEYQARARSYVFYRDAPGLTFSQLQQYVIGAIYNKNIKGFILDYWQLVGGKGKNQSTSEHLEAIAQWIADFCRKRNIWAIVTAQINQEGNTRGSEGMRLAFDQVYQLNRPEGNKDVAWLEMMDSRYTAWMNVGSDNSPEFILDGHGPYFKAR